MPINSVSLSGNLGRDAEYRTFQNGGGMASFSICVNERRKNQAGEYEDRPNWFRCSLFGPRAEKLAPHLTKGTRLAVSGRLRASEYEKDGEKRTSIEVVVDDLEFMSSKNGPAGQQDGGYGPYGAYTAPAPAQAPMPPQNVTQAPAAVQQMVNDAFRNPVPGNSPASMWADEAIPF